MPFLPPNQQRQCTEGSTVKIIGEKINKNIFASMISCTIPATKCFRKMFLLVIVSSNIFAEFLFLG